MPRADEHRTWATRNEAFHEQVDADRWPDWSAVTIFYTALHEIQAMLEDRRAELSAYGMQVPRSHSERKDVLGRYAPDIGSAYEAMQARADRARYRCMDPRPQELVLMKALLGTVRDEIKKRP